MGMFDDLIEKKEASSQHGGQFFNDLIPEESAKMMRSVTYDTGQIGLPDIDAGTAGGMVGGIAKTVKGRTLLSALLGAGAEGYHQVYQQLTGSPDAPATSQEAALRMASVSAAQGGGQLIGEGIVAGASKIIPRVKPEYLLQGHGDAEKAIQPYVDKYFPPGLLARTKAAFTGTTPLMRPGFTIGQKVEPYSGAAKMESIVESSFTGAGPIKRLKFAQEKAIDGMVNDLSNIMWQGISKMPPSAQGQVFLDAFKVADEAFDSTSRVLYKRVSDLNKDVVVDIRPIKSWAQSMSEENAKRAGIGASQMGDSLISKVGNLPDQVDFSTAQSIRTGFRLEKNSVERKDVARGIAAKLEGLTDKMMDAAATKLSPEGKEAWRQANEFYANGKETFDNGFIRNLVQKGKEQPELIGRAVFQNGEISQIQKVKEILKGDQNTWQNMKAGFLQSYIEKATNAEGQFLGTTFYRSLKGMGNETLREIFTPKELNLIRLLDRASVTSQKKIAGGGGSMLIQLMQAGPLANVATIVASGGLMGGGIYENNPEMFIGGLGILFTPRILAKMMVSPKYQKLFIEGISTSRPVSMPAISKLVTGAIQTNADLERRMQGVPKEIKLKPMNPFNQEDYYLKGGMELRGQ